MADASLGLYNALNRYSDLEDLIAEGEAESLDLECKSPGSPQLGKDQKNALAKAISGFSNTAGGVILWGISTTRHAHSGLDVLTQIEPIGQCSSLAGQLASVVPRLTIPPVLNVTSKTIKRRPNDTKGIVATHIPKHLGDPVQSNEDNLFYFRSGDEFTVAPYEMIQRLFLATISPDLHPVFASALVKLAADGFWEVPIVVENRSSAVGQHVMVSIEVLNPSSCEKISATSFTDESDVNIGKTVFHRALQSVIHRGLNTIAGTLRVKMKVGRRSKRVLRLEIAIYADKMRARQVAASFHLAKKKISVELKKEKYMY